MHTRAFQCLHPHKLRAQGSVAVIAAAMNPHGIQFIVLRQQFIYRILSMLYETQALTAQPPLGQGLQGQLL